MKRPTRVGGGVGVGVGVGVGSRRRYEAVDDLSASAPLS
jgi:hypothetical protein